MFEISKIFTGFIDLDRHLNGLRDGNLIVIGGKSIGKTNLALNISSNAAINDTCVSYFSIGTKEEDIINRLISSIGTIDIYKMHNTKLLTAEDYEKATIAVGSLSKLPLYIDDSPILYVNEIEQKVLENKEKHPDIKHLVVVDYLSLVTPEDQQNRYEQTDYIVKKLKIMSRTLNCPIILLVNLSRRYETRIEKSICKRPLLSDLRDTGTIEEDADVIILLYREEVFDKETENPRIAELHIAKDRNAGQCGIVELAYLGEYSKFVNIDRSKNKEDVFE